MPFSSAPLKDWLRARRVANNLYLDMMALRYDLDGALKAGQLGLAWRAQEELLCDGMQLHLAQVGVQVPTRQEDDRLDLAFRIADALERTNPALAADAWRLWLRPVPPDNALVRETQRTLTFLAESLGHPWVITRRDTVARWASDTQILRTVAKEFGVAQSDDWYLSAATPGLPAEDWYREVLASLELERTA